MPADLTGLNSLFALAARKLKKKKKDIYASNTPEHLVFKKYILLQASSSCSFLLNFLICLFLFLISFMMSVFVCALLETGGTQINNYTSPLQKLWPRHLLEPSPPAPSLQQGARKLWLPQQAVRLEAYMHQLFLRVVLLGAVLPVAVGLIDDHLGLLLAVIPVQVFLEVS